MNKSSLPRIAALWAFSEAFLGGILHGFRVPFTGLFMAFFASLCITLIAMADKKTGAILKITLAVITVKFMLSPYTPPMAYIAVLVQGLAGELFFAGRRFIKTGAFLLALFSLLYSAFQFLLTLTIILGKKGLIALDEFLDNITQSISPSATHYSIYLVIIYISCYLVAGIAAGVLSIRIINQLNTGTVPQALLEHPDFSRQVNEQFTEKKAKKKQHPFLFSAGLICLALLLLSYFPAFQNNLLLKKPYGIISRGVLILLCWFYLLSPLMTKMIGHWAARYQQKNTVFFSQLLGLLPETRNIILYSWKVTGSSSRFSRLKKFITVAIWLTAYYEERNTDIDRTHTKR